MHQQVKAIYWWILAYPSNSYPIYVTNELDKIRDDFGFLNTDVARSILGDLTQDAPDS